MGSTSMTAALACVCFNDDAGDLAVPPGAAGPFVVAISADARADCWRTPRAATFAADRAPIAPITSRRWRCIVHRRGLRLLSVAAGPPGVQRGDRQVRIAEAGGRGSCSSVAAAVEASGDDVDSSQRKRRWCAAAGRVASSSSPPDVGPGARRGRRRDGCRAASLAASRRRRVPRAGPPARIVTAAAGGRRRSV